MEARNCPNCGAAIEFAEGQRLITCEFCHTTVELPPELIATLEIIPDVPDPVPIEIVAEAIDEFAPMRKQLQEKILANDSSILQLENIKGSRCLYASVFFILALLACGLGIFAYANGSGENMFLGSILIGSMILTPLMLIFSIIFGVFYMVANSEIEELHDDSAHLREAIAFFTPGVKQYRQESNWKESLAEKAAEFAIHWMLD